MSFCYSTFGLRLQSNIEIPGPLSTQGFAKADVTISLGQIPKELHKRFDHTPELVFRTPLAEAEEKLSVHKAGDCYRLRYHDDTTFLINEQGTQLWASWTSPLTIEDTATYLLGPILGFVLRLRGVHCLHASAFSLGGQAIALVGPAGAGKSTTAAAFANLGYPVLTDDVLPLVPDTATRFVIHSAYPRVRLWDDSADLLFGTSTKLPLLTPNWDKRYLDLAQGHYRFQQEPLPLAAIYLLAEREDSFEAPFVEQVSPNEGVMSLVGNTYVNYLLDKPMRREEFELLGSVARNIPIRRITPHVLPTKIAALCDLILKDFDELTISDDKTRIKSCIQ